MTTTAPAADIATLARDAARAELRLTALAAAADAVRLAEGRYIRGVEQEIDNAVAEARAAWLRAAAAHVQAIRAAQSAT